MVDDDDGSEQIDTSTVQVMPKPNLGDQEETIWQRNARLNPFSSYGSVQDKEEPVVNTTVLAAPKNQTVNATVAQVAPKVPEKSEQ